MFCAKVVADRFNRGIFEAYLDLACVPFLPEPMTSSTVSSVTNQLTAADVMATGVTALPPVIAIPDLLHVLKSTSFQVSLPHFSGPEIACFQQPGNTIPIVLSRLDL